MRDCRRRKEDVKRQGTPRLVLGSVQQTYSYVCCMVDS